MTRPGYATARPAATRKWLAVFALLSFFLQSLAVQTHIHQQLPVANSFDMGTSAPVPAKNQDPVDQCRLCQELVHAGTFITPSAVVSLLSLTFVTASIARVLTLAADPATAFAWQSRAPPRR